MSNVASKASQVGMSRAFAVAFAVMVAVALLMMTASATLAVTAPAAPVISSPPEGSYDNDGAFTLSGTAAKAYTIVQVFDESSGRFVGTVSVNALGKWQLTLSGLSDGKRAYKARVYDKQYGVYSEWSNIRTVIVDTKAPAAPSITTPTEGSVNPGSFDIAGTAEVNSTVELFEGSISKGTVKTNLWGNWSIELTGVSDGSHSYTAKATDVAGNVSDGSQLRTVTVDTKAPRAPSITAPEEGSTYLEDTPIAFSGIAEPNSTVELVFEVNGRLFYEGLTKANLSGPGFDSNWSRTVNISVTQDNTFAFKARARDAAGNFSGWSNIRTIKILETGDGYSSCDGPPDPCPKDERPHLSSGSW